MTEDEAIIERINELSAPLGKRKRATEAIRAHTTTKEKVKANRRAQNREQEVMVMKRMEEGRELGLFNPGGGA